MSTSSTSLPIPGFDNLFRMPARQAMPLTRQQICAASRWPAQQRVVASLVILRAAASEDGPDLPRRDYPAGPINICPPRPLRCAPGRTGSHRSVKDVLEVRGKRLYHNP